MVCHHPQKRARAASRLSGCRGATLRHAAFATPRAEHSAPSKKSSTHHAAHSKRSVITSHTSHTRRVLNKRGPRVSAANADAPRRTPAVLDTPSDPTWLQAPIQKRSNSQLTCERTQLPLSRPHEKPAHAGQARDTRQLTKRKHHEDAPAYSTPPQTPCTCGSQ